jgi:hypothetical protein
MRCDFNAVGMRAGAYTKNKVRIPTPSTSLRAGSCRQERANGAPACLFWRCSVSVMLI